MFSLHIDTARTWRGGQNQVLLTVLGLRARGHRAVLVARPGGELARRASEGHDLVLIAPAHEMDFAAAFRLARVVRDLKPDVVHAHDPHAVSMAAMAISAMADRRRPPLVIARRVDFHLKRNAFSRWKYQQVDAAICSSNAIRAMLVEDGVAADAAFTVYEGVQVDRIRALPAADLCKELWLPPGSPTIGNVAALVPHKGQRYLIDAAPAVIRAVPDAHILIFGEGELRPALTRQIRHLGLEHRVQLAGFRPDVLSLLKGLDVFVMCSLTEGLGTSILDAMAASRPVVGTTAGGIPEAVEDGVTGILVPPHNAAALAAALLRLLGDEALRRRMGEAGLERVREQFSVDRMIDGILAVYEAVAGRRREAGTGSPPPVS
ncbi:MAG TPA: glycosyltransferase [Vicinamibacterales bacterium]|nr:glycosyltransferase [Vicinamibacterales bacterium]HPW20126.1 glycosyltransferase [Vicinamibacterales bacterium]